MVTKVNGRGSWTASKPSNSAPQRQSPGAHWKKKRTKKKNTTTKLTHNKQRNYDFVEKKHNLEEEKKHNLEEEKKHNLEELKNSFLSYV